MFPSPLNVVSLPFPAASPTPDTNFGVAQPSNFKTRCFWITDNALTDDEWLDIDFLASQYEDVVRQSAGAIKYLIVARDTAPTTNKRHLHIFVQFKGQKRISSIKSAFPRGERLHIIFPGSEKHKKNCIEYCEKKDWWRDWGTRPLSSQEKGEAEKERWLLAFAAAKRGKFEEIDPQIAISHYSNLRLIHNDTIIEHDLPHTINQRQHFFFFWGYPRTGKSRLARDLGRLLAPDEEPFLKDCSNKWWTGYNKELVVLIEDVDTTAKNLAMLYKVWLDRYAFAAETKGGSFKRIRPRYIFVTSNHSIPQIWGKLDKNTGGMLDSPDSVAIEERVSIVYFEHQLNNPDAEFYYQQKKNEVLQLLDTNVTAVPSSPSEAATQPLHLSLPPTQENSPEGIINILPSPQNENYSFF